MPTIAKLVADGAILPIEVELNGRDQACRMLLGTPKFVEWLIERQAADEDSPSGAELTPLEQLDALFATFISGEALHHTRQFRNLRPSERAVWELKTRDFRVFGWFLQHDVFLALFGEWTDKVKDHNLYHGYISEVVRIRDQMGLSDVLCVKGVRPNEVISV